ncbi:hypothetical protein [Corallococcus aberystwythensis]|uniref:Uncharacterized protein n=1 Tax=Corallococcus aberystwythensis TaxID=2316722 RepID=A0A3A8QLP8_9BACT|nr:hypothetical protein [Corallococcus aberystwythensis]RKH65762.1 hypothetical protein D7W81_16475 [Corallococcus aberystwythensis]
MADSTPPPPNAVPPSLARVAFHAVAAGLTPLIPVPFLDDYALRQVREQAVRDQFKEKGLKAPDKAVAVLAGSYDARSVGGRLVSYLKTVALFPVRKVFRKVFFVLWVKDCVDLTSVCLHHGYLLRHALERGDLDAASLQGDTPRKVQAAIIAACGEMDARPINQALRRIFRSSRVLMAEAALAFLEPKRASAREPDPKGESEEVRSLTDRLLQELWEERGYFTALEAHYDKHLKSGLAPAEPWAATGS